MKAAPLKGRFKRLLFNLFLIVLFIVCFVSSTMFISTVDKAQSLSDLFFDYDLLLLIPSLMLTIYLVFRFGGGMMRGLLFLGALLIGIIAPPGLLGSFAGLALVQRKLNFSGADTLFIPLLAGLFGTYLMLDDYEFRLKQGAEAAAEAYRVAYKQTVQLEKDLPQLLQKHAWFAEAEPDSTQWPKRVKLSKANLESLQNQDIPELKNLKDTAGIFAVSPLLPLTMKVNAVLEANKADMQPMQDKLKALTDFARDLKQNLSNYERNYQQTQPGYVRQVEQWRDQALRDWPRPEVEKALSEAWKLGAWDKLADSQVGDKATQLWNRHQRLYQAAQQGRIDREVYTQLPQVWQEMTQLAGPFRAASQRLTPLLHSLYTQWEKLLVDMTIKDGWEVKFTQSYRYIKLSLPHMGQPGRVESKDKILEVQRAIYNRYEPFMGMAVEHKPLGQFEQKSSKTVLPSGYSFLASSRNKQNAFGEWHNSTWQWRDPYQAAGDLLWKRYYQPTLAEFKQFEQTAHNQVYLGSAGNSGNQSLFGNAGMFTLLMYSASQYYRNKMYRSTRYISSGRTWYGSRYETSSSDYRGGSYSGSRSGGGK